MSMRMDMTDLRGRVWADSVNYPWTGPVRRPAALDVQETLRTPPDSIVSSRRSPSSSPSPPRRGRPRGRTRTPIFGCRSPGTPSRASLRRWRLRRVGGDRRHHRRLEDVAGGSSVSLPGRPSRRAGVSWCDLQLRRQGRRDPLIGVETTAGTRRGSVRSGRCADSTAIAPGPTPVGWSATTGRGWWSPPTRPPRARRTNCTTIERIDKNTRRRTTARADGRARRSSRTSRG